MFTNVKRKALLLESSPMEQHELNASSFAEMIGVQRSSISHVLSGRNKPSLEFLAKIEATFDEVSFEWLLEKKINRLFQPHPYPF